MNLQNSHGETPLHYASRAGIEEIVSLLLAKYNYSLFVCLPRSLGSLLSLPPPLSPSLSLLIIDVVGLIPQSKESMARTKRLLAHLPPSSLLQPNELRLVQEKYEEKKRSRRRRKRNKEKRGSIREVSRIRSRRE